MPRPDESHHVVPESRFPLPPTLFRSLFLSRSRAPVLSPSREASPAILLAARVADKRERATEWWLVTPAPYWRAIALFVPEFAPRSANGTRESPFLTHRLDFLQS